MPSLEQIERFKAVLNSLGSEPEILAERGESIEDLPPPEAGPPDLSDLFAGGPSPGPAAPPAEGAPPRPAARKAAPPPEAGEETFDFGSVFGPEAVEGLDNLEMPAAEPAAEPGAGEAVAGGEDLDKIFAGLGLEPEAPPEPAEPAAGEEAETAKALEEFGIPPGLLETLGEPAQEQAEAAPAVEAMAATAPAAEEELGEFTLPADFAIHEEGVPEEALPPAPAAEAPPAAEEAAEQAAAEQAAAEQLPADFLAGLGMPGEADEAAGQAAPAPESEAPFQLPEEFLAPPAEAAAQAPEAAEGEAPAAGPKEEEELFAFPEMPSVGSAEAGAEPGKEEISALPEEFTGEEAFGEEPAEEAPAPAPAEAPAAAARPEAPPAEAAGPQPEESGISERRFAALQRTLSALPRNLKMAIEELIGEKGLTGPDLRLLTDLLASGAAPVRLAEEVSRISGRRIRLPRGYEKLTGLAFEEERRRFGFALRENVWPVVRAAVLSLLFLGLLSYVGYRFIYRPVAAWVLYRQGHAQILKQRSTLAEERFAKANAIIRYKRWYLRYAQAYTGRRQYPLAADKYELLLRHFPLDRQGILAYAGLLTYSTFGYERAERILGEYIGEYEVEAQRKRFVPRAGFRDADILLARGDNFLDWAEERPEHFESARMQYASILDYYGERDEVLLRMLRYFIRYSHRESRLKETRDLYRLLEAKDKKRRLEVDPQLLASVYSELAGFWFDQQAYDDVHDALQAAMGRVKLHPEVHYQLARYYRYLADPVEERKALVNAIQLLERSTPFTRRRLLALIDSYNRLGESYWRDREYLNAERYFQLAIARIETGQAQRVLGISRDLGLPYKNRGDIYYYISRDLNAAYEQYRQAERNLLSSDELDYQMGYIDYTREDFEPALLRFSKVVDSRPTSENALFALANALYLQGHYASAQGYYLRLLDLQEARRDRTPNLQPAENSEHHALLEYLMKVYNNLGVATMRLSERGRDPARQARALANLTFSSEYFDLLTRDPDTLERGQTRNLAYLNQRAILYPTRTFELEIYGRLPLDLAAIRF
jgi:tetratricopeptide (TPR) repeat protein